MRAKMLVEARIVGDPDRVFAVGQELEGADAELQVGLGQAEVLPEPEAPAEAPKKAKASA
jgi:hypothetical protein